MHPVVPATTTIQRTHESVSCEGIWYCMGIGMRMGNDEIRKSGHIYTFKDLDAWKQGHVIVLEVYRCTKTYPREEQFGLVNQMRRAAISVTSNIAEGFGRQTGKDKAQFYTIAKGSLLELQSQLQASLDLGYIPKDTYELLDALLERAVRVTYGLIRSANGQ